MKDGRNIENNNDERNNSSLSSSVRERAMENEGKELQAARERTAQMPHQLSSNGKAIAPQSSLPNKNSIGDTGSGLNKNSGIPGKVSLPNKEALSKLNKGKSGNPSPNNASGKPSSNIASRGNDLKSKVASAGLQAMGVPKGISDGLVNSKLGKKAMNMAKNPAMAALNGLKSAGKSEAEKDAAEKEEEEKEKEKRTGNIVLRVPLKVKLVILLALLPSFCLILMFMVIVVAYEGDEKMSAIFYGNSTGKGNSSVSDKVGRGDDLGMGGSYSTYDEFLSRYENLGNLYEYFDCKSEEECLERDEVKFYIKVNDISLRYKRKYGVSLDWKLLMSTALSMDLDVVDMHVAFLNNYNYDDVEKFDILMNLDWDYDYKKISGYAYLSPSQYLYDLQILAKNMVTKDTTQTCSKTVTNEDGSTSVIITKTKSDTDVEDQYLQPGQPYYLQCDAGESYDISSMYRLDLEKYDDFLLEYIEHKLYLEEEEASTVDENGNTDMTPSPATGEYIFPLPSGATRCRSSAFGYRIHPITGEHHYHSGDDYPAAAGTSVYATADGTVIAAGYDKSMGNYIRLDHGNGIVSIYMHASKLFVSKGDTVKQGDVIMAVGTTGSSTGNHLHISFKKNGNLDDPKNYIGALNMCS